MDAELKQYLESMEGRMQSMEGYMQSMEGRLVTLITGVKESLEREIHPIKDAVGRIELRLSRQGGLIQGGVRQVARLATWSEDVDQLLAERDVRIEDLTRRVENLERPEGK